MSTIVGILLAAGSSTRFGASKLLHPLPDGTAVGVAAARALVQAVPDSVAVVRAGDTALMDALSRLGMRVVENPHAEEGIATSLATAINAAADADGWIVALADMPWVQTRTITMLVERLRFDASMVAPVYQGQRGHPVGFSARWQQSLRSLSGDIGARDLLAEHAHELELLTTTDAGVLRDIDCRQDMFEEI